MAYITGVVKSPIKGKKGTIKRSSGYEYRDFYYTNSSGKKIRVVGWHRAIDITTLGTIIAFERGKVLSVIKNVQGQTTNPSGGNQVMLEHANGDRTVYCHLDYKSIPSDITKGAIVEANQKLGTDTIKTTGNSTGLHLHFAIRENGKYVDPTDYLQGRKSLHPYEIIKPEVHTMYTVKSGDTLSKIGKLYNVNWKDIYDDNKKSIGHNPNLIKVGQLLIIPCVKSDDFVTYTVISGDSLSAIAREFNTTWQKIYADNKSTIGSNPNVIRKGQKLVIKK